MKSVLITAAALSGLVSVLSAEEIVGGPKGGRLLQTEPLKTEFFVTEDRKAEIVFYDESLNPTAPGTQSVNIIAEAKDGRVTLDMEETSTGFISTEPLPAGEPYRVVVQVRHSPEERPKNFRIELELYECAECQRAEYACTCGH